MKEVYELGLYSTQWEIYDETYVVAPYMPPAPQICDARMCGNSKASLDEEDALDDADGAEGYSKAHARLIAAAPDLYDALRELFLVSSKVSPTAKETVKALNKAHAALEKAGGAESMEEEERRNQ